MDQLRFEIKRGDTWNLSLHFQNSDCNNIDITDWVIYFTLKEVISDTDGVTNSSSILEKDIVVHSEPVNGKTEISLTPEDTNLDQKTYLFDIQVKTNEDEIYTLTEGLILITKDVTTRS